MKTGTVLGIILIVLGAISLAYQGVSYTTHKKVLDIGSIHATKEEHKTIPLPPIRRGSGIARWTRACIRGFKERLIRRAGRREVPELQPRHRASSQSEDLGSTALPRVR